VEERKKGKQKKKKKKKGTISQLMPTTILPTHIQTTKTRKSKAQWMPSSENWDGGSKIFMVHIYMYMFMYVCTYMYVALF